VSWGKDENKQKEAKICPFLKKGSSEKAATKWTTTEELALILAWCNNAVMY